ncbi:MAG: mechanosensitive ion channel family protein [Flavobacteriales bacterium]|jgi:small conductance mechanosensitive channel|nr:mechanosensitive ion channel family protein [Flavobacteriales bacterium]MBK6550944.1 mechanosensitive ion channel family protein [Flavobacteriales bacterium]MBK6882501.1 mechanosensitive ion channel family protein [Flavobacteriales bacterium]MBK7101284.1 mechanosensitive ion channel family protein [Flavobacteriales bacterium]MBK7111991.1 mechanosensitive ion channel family protein [Flavobacteriales bacterium]
MPTPTEDAPGALLTFLRVLGMDLLILLKIVAVLAAAWLVERITYLILRRGYARRKARGRDEFTQYRFLRNAVRTVVVVCAFFAVVYTIPALRSFAFTLFAGAGLLVAILGFAAQKAFSDIISGIFIVAFRPFRVGDVIQVGQQGLFGTVEDINLRHTTFLTFENRRVVIPNSIIGEERIVNSSIRDESTCQFVEIPVAVNADLERARSIMQRVAKAHPAQYDNRSVEEKAAGEPEVAVRVVDIKDGVVNLRAYVWAADPVTARVMRYDLTERILIQFAQEHIPIAVPIQHFVQQNPFRTLATGAVDIQQDDQ